MDEATRKSLELARRGGVVRHDRIILYDLAALTDNTHGHLKARRYSGEIVAQKEVLVILEAFQGFSHPFQGILLDDSHAAQAVAFALLYDQVLLHQDLEGVAHRGLVQAELIAQASGGLGLTPVRQIPVVRFRAKSCIAINGIKAFF